MNDRCGIPDNFFGQVEEEFYGLIRRVVMVAALVEQKLLALSWTIDRSNPQDVHAGKTSAQLLKICRDGLGRRAPFGLPDGTELLDRTEQVLQGRHAVVHSLWPDAGLAKAYRWRPVTKTKRPQDGHWILDDTTNGSEVEALITALIDVVEHLDHFRQQVEAAHQRAAGGAPPL